VKNASEQSSTVARLDEATHTGSTQAGADTRGNSNLIRVADAAHTAGFPKLIQTPGADPVVASPARSSRTVRSILIGLLLLVVLAYFGRRYFVYSRSWVTTDNAYLAGHIHAISSRVAGTVTEVLVDENQTVSAGTVLARLDPADLNVRRQQAVAQVAQAAAQAQEALARIAQAEAQVAREQAGAIKASNDLARAQRLFEGGQGAISKQELDLAKSESDAADAGLHGARSALVSAGAQAAAAEAQAKVAQSTLQETELQLSYTEIVAPAKGRIGKKNVEIGNRIQPGQALLALVDPNVWVTANFKETQLTHLKPGQAVRIRADAFPDHTFRGVVDGLSPASGAQFALLPPDNATGNFTKIVQRVPVKIRLDPTSFGDFAGRLAAGMSVTVEVNVRDNP